MSAVHNAAETGTLTANLVHTASSSLPDGTPVRAGLALLRATTAERGLSRAIADAASAYDAIENHSPWKAFACLFAGTALRLQGHRDHAEEALHESYDRAALTMPALAAACLVQLAWVAMDEGEWEQARSYAARAQAFVESSGPGHEVTTFAAKVTGLFLSARQGDVKSGHRHVKDAIRQVPLGPSPGLAAIEARIVASQALVLLSDHAAAHRLLAEARLQTSRLREPGSLVEKIEQARAAPSMPHLRRLR